MATEYVKFDVVEKLICVSEQDPDLKFTAFDFQDNMDSTVLNRERTQGSKQ